MREINNNINGNVNFNKGGIQPKPHTDDGNSRNQQTPNGTNGTNDLSKMPAASLGKVQVNASDGIERDMNYFVKNPELTATLNRVIDDYAKTHTPEETLKFMDKAVEEFSTKNN